jgi:hypothetical protein
MTASIRTAYFKVKDHEDRKKEEFILDSNSTYTSVTGLDPQKSYASFRTVPTNPFHELELIICFNYGSYPKL